ncbi:undecaprenyl-phosphate alpha-N-acetylglucosaminyl 1-phosphate transferase [Pseudoalteromonas piscicida]|uniref:Undecaprenyl-phosphate alpha-N-acetylglucosaminyl 1-phosphate transferase n=2 Tax=Pseudoalteromonas piscicida TaxID=43662 RepID=A0A2A5JVZ7_PSEO7|nr:undecaprenyl-phosphate alpha-N-acetylglucosaminyl 1-phosphate transferase [Pseudoalteromonas piscicida]
MLAISALLSFTCVKLFSTLAPKLGLLDTPCERKQHNGRVPLIGGISIFISFSWTLLLFDYLNTQVILVLISMSFMVFIGVLDDKYQLSVRARLIGQVLSASIIVFGLDLYLVSLGDIFGFGELYLGSFGYLVTFIAILGAINAFNMIDGIDGLLGGLSIVSFTGILAISYLRDNAALFNLSAVIIVTLVPFMVANLGGSKFFKRKVFMGDAGSMFIGLFIVWMLIAGTSGYSFEHGSTFRPVFALYIVALPLMDMVAIMYRRAKKGKSPFHPDRNHIHHIFMRAGCSSKQALLSIILISQVILVAGLLMEIYLVPDFIMFFIFLFLFYLYNYLIQHAWRVVKVFRKLNNVV